MPKPLKELLAESDGGVVGLWDDARREMARRLRKLDEYVSRVSSVGRDERLYPAPNPNDKSHRNTLYWYVVRGILDGEDDA
jgi:hypothetical protein